jgi:hypothetical protein
MCLAVAGKVIRALIQVCTNGIVGRERRHSGRTTRRLESLTGAFDRVLGLHNLQALFSEGAAMPSAMEMD